MSGAPPAAAITSLTSGRRRAGSGGRRGPRTRRDAPLNVGQVYSTLDRLRRDGLIEDAGSTPDNLPLYGLTDAGAIEARMYLTEPDLADWHDMVERVLLALSLPGDHVATLVANYRRP